MLMYDIDLIVMIRIKEYVQLFPLIFNHSITNIETNSKYNRLIKGGDFVKRKIIATITLIFCAFILIKGISYIPQKLVNIQAKEVTKIEITDGTTGQQLEITDEMTVARIINNLNSIVFQKDKLASENKGYRFAMKIYVHNKLEQSLMINSEDMISYQNYFYKTTNKQIDQKYLEDLLSGN